MAGTDSILIAGKTFTIPQPFDEGHVLTAGEANQLNQVFGENIRNNFAKKVKTADEAGSFDQDAFQQMLDEYADKYQFGVRAAGGGGGRRDPVQAEAVSMATDRVKEALKKGGKNLKDYSGKQLREAALKLLDRDPSIKEKAKEIVAQKQDVASTSLDDIVNSITPTAEDSPTSQPAAEAA